MIIIQALAEGGGDGSPLAMSKMLVAYFAVYTMKYATGRDVIKKVIMALAPENFTVLYGPNLNSGKS